MKREEARARAADRCWAVIGALGGDRSCHILRERAHCRECDVLALAADDLLAGTALEGVGERARGDADRASDEARASNAGGRLVAVTFEAGGHALALEVAQVIEVGAVRPVRRLPHRAGPIFRGLVSVKGRLEPCFSLAAALGLSEEEADGERRLLVIGRPGRACAFHVARVSLVETGLALVGDPPATVSTALDTHVRGILQGHQGATFAWLDSERVLSTLERSLG